MEVNIPQARTTLSNLVDLGFRGETIIITVRGKGRIQLVPEPEHTRMGGFGMFSHLQERLTSGWKSQHEDDNEDAVRSALFGGTE